MLAAALLALAAFACDDDTPTGEGGGFRPYEIVMETTMGDITFELFPQDAPVTVENFDRYVRERFYDGILIHRVIQGFMIQGGTYDADLVLRPPTHPPIFNEAANGLTNVRGTLAMARTFDPHSATSSFFINVVDNGFLDHQDTDTRYGYCVFGRVIGGMEVVDAINSVPTHAANGMSDVPVIPVMILRVRRVGFSHP